MFTRSARIYDAIYSYKDYAAEARYVDDLIVRHRGTRGSSLLDVACGTGGHIPYLAPGRTVEGLDRDEDMIAVARDRHPGIAFHSADMRSFDLGRTFDAVVCLFSAIGYVRSARGLVRAARAMARHVAPGGVLVVEPWLTPDRLKPGTVHAVFVDRPDLKVARMNVTRVEGGLAVLDFHYMVGTPAGVEEFRERHAMGNFTHDQYVAALESTGLQVTSEPQGPTGRGIYIALRCAAGAASVT